MITNKDTDYIDLEISKNIHKKNGVSYYFATLFFPKEIKEATFSVYAFFRIPDDIVDDINDNIESKNQKLNYFIDQWNLALNNPEKYKEVIIGEIQDIGKSEILNLSRETRDKISIYNTALTFKKYDIPVEYSITFLEAMKQDLCKEKYLTEEEMNEYMVGSAEAVGLIMTSIIGFWDKSAIYYARLLGNSMQITNFLRDIYEDYVHRNRIYIPIEYFNKFNALESFKNKVNDDNFKSLMKFYIDKNRKMYEEANRGIKFLNNGRLSVLLSSNLYSAILDKIEDNDYDVFNKRARTNLFEKIIITIKTIWQITILKKY